MILDLIRLIKLHILKDLFIVSIIDQQSTCQKRQNSSPNNYLNDLSKRFRQSIKYFFNQSHVSRAFLTDCSFEVFYFFLLQLPVSQLFLLLKLLHSPLYVQHFAVQLNTISVLNSFPIDTSPAQLFAVTSHFFHFFLFIGSILSLIQPVFDHWLFEQVFVFCLVGIFVQKLL